MYEELGIPNIIFIQGAQLQNDGETRAVCNAWWTIDKKVYHKMRVQDSWKEDCQSSKINKRFNS